MASPGEMVARVAKVLGVPEETVALYDRNLAEAGLRTKGGRGRSAAQMTARDVANILIAIAGSSLVKDAAETVAERFGPLVCWIGTTERKIGPDLDEVGRPASWDLEGLPLPKMQALVFNHRFDDALVALLESAASGDLQAAVDALPLLLVDDRPLKNKCRITVAVSGPKPKAMIELKTRDFKEKHDYVMTPAQRKKWERSHADLSGFLRQRRTFDHNVVWAVADLTTPKSRRADID